jgi:hypothetical protein
MSSSSVRTLKRILIFARGVEGAIDVPMPVIWRGVSTPIGAIEY